MPAKCCGCAPARPRSTCRGAAAAFRRRRERRRTRRSCASTAITAEDQRGAPLHVHHPARRSSSARARLRAVVRLDGALVERLADRPWLDASMRLSFFAGLGTVHGGARGDQPARRQASRRRLGSRRSGIGARFAICRSSWPPTSTSLADVWGSLDHSDHMEPAGRAVRRVSGIERRLATGSTSITSNRDDRVPATFRGFRAMRDERLIEGLRATPIASIGGGDVANQRGVAAVLAGVPEIDRSRQPALRRRHVPARLRRSCTSCRAASAARSRFAMCFGRDTVSAEPLAWVRSPLCVSADPLSYRQAGAWAPLAAGSRLSAEGYEALDQHGDRRRRQLRTAPRDDRRIRLAELWRALCGPRSGRRPGRLALQQPVRRGRRLRHPLHADRRSPVVDARPRPRAYTSPTSTSTTPTAIAPPTAAATSGTRSTTRPPARPRIAPTRSAAARRAAVRARSTTTPPA